MKTAWLISLMIFGVIMTKMAEGQTTPLDGALASWQLGQGPTAWPQGMLSPVGSILYNQTPQGIGARPQSKAAKLTSAYFNAGKALNVVGEGVTVYLRACDPTGQWNYGLLAKRGSHQLVCYNLFSVDLAETDGPDIGFEISTDQGFAVVSFPISRIDPTAWHCLVGRYDGQHLEIICDDRVMDSKPWSGRLTQNSEPALIGAETDNGSITRPFSGYVEEAAIWASALSDERVAALARRPSLAPYDAALLHYKHPDHAVGDMHPYYKDGVYYVNYLYDPGTWSVGQLRSRDLIHWEWFKPTHAPAAANQLVPNFFALAMIYDPLLGKHRTFYGCGGMRSSISDDLLNWQAAQPQLAVPDYQLYDRFSDPYVFWNDTDRQYWMVMTLRKKNLPMETAGAIGYATSENLTAWTWRGELYFPGNVGDPECPSMFRMGSKWYLLASYASGGVGKTSWRVADSPRGPWTAMTPASLDGKDLCAGESCHDGHRRLLFGWIPLLASQPGSQYWGGHMAFPRVVGRQEDGRLTSRLPESIGQAIRGDQIFPAPSEEPAARLGLWTLSGQSAQFRNVDRYGVATLPGLYDRLDAFMQIQPGSGCRRAGWLLGWSDSDSGYEVGIDLTGQRLFIATAAGTVHSELPLALTRGTAHTLRVIVEDNIVEAFLDDQYSLVARLPEHLRGTSLALFSDGGPTNFSSCAVYRLKSLAQATLPHSSVSTWREFQ